MMLQMEDNPEWYRSKTGSHTITHNAGSNSCLIMYWDMSSYPIGRYHVIHMPDSKFFDKANASTEKHTYKFNRPSNAALSTPRPWLWAKVKTAGNPTHRPVNFVLVVVQSFAQCSVQARVVQLQRG